MISYRIEIRNPNKMIITKESRIQSAYDEAGKKKRGRLNYVEVEKERRKKRNEERGGRGKFTEGVVWR